VRELKAPRAGQGAEHVPGTGKARIRRPGGGRKHVEESDLTLLTHLDALLDWIPRP